MIETLFDSTYSSPGNKVISSIFTNIRSPDGATTVHVHSMCAGGIFGYKGDVI